MSILSDVMTWMFGEKYVPEPPPNEVLFADGRAFYAGQELSESDKKFLKWFWTHEEWLHDPRFNAYGFGHHLKPPEETREQRIARWQREANQKPNPAGWQ